MTAKILNTKESGMAFISDPRGARRTESDTLTRAQLIFAAAGLAIIFGGLWLISEMNAPYHPQEEGLVIEGARFVGNEG